MQILNTSARVITVCVRGSQKTVSVIIHVIQKSD